MKSSSIFLLLLSCYFLQAQPVITSANNFQPGDSLLLYHKHDGSLSIFSVGASGANAVWDFSAMDFNHPSVIVDTLFYLQPAGTPFYPVTLSADYSFSNLCFLRKTDPFDTRNFDYNYYYADNDSLSFIGHWADNTGNDIWEDHCTDFIKEIAYPFAYTDNYTDSFERFYGDMSGSGGHYITGSRTVTADGYGTLMTPDGITLNNVLRVHIVEMNKDSNALFGVTLRTIHTYRWYSPFIKGFILSIEMDAANAVILLADYQKQTNVAASVNEINSPFGFNIHPNPSNGVFTIHSNKTILLVDIYNRIGQCVSHTNYDLLSCNIDLNISFLPKGMYVVKATSAEKVITKKILIE